jgi:AIR synthase-related protein
MVIESELEMLLRQVREHAGIGLKQDIGQVSRELDPLPPGWHPNGDDTAAIPIEGGWQLLAIEGMQGRLVREQPWFAGWCAVMVNCSDIAAMGGRPVAVVDALWADIASAPEGAAEVVKGMRDACRVFGLSLVGGHTNLRAATPSLAVSVLGQAKALLSSFAARPGQALVMAVDLRGEFTGPGNWNAATSAPPERLRGDMALLPQIAENGLAIACKDISQAGVLGTLLMLLESSAVGAHVHLPDIPKAAGVDWQTWLTAFPSFGYLLTCSRDQEQALLDVFHQRNIAAAVIGDIRSGHSLTVTDQKQTSEFYDLKQGLTGFRADESRRERYA